MNEAERQRHAKVSRLFDEAMEQPPAERAAWLDRACEGDSELRREVGSLIDALGEASGFLETPITAAVHGEATAMIGKTVAGYRIERVLAVGGMGAVYLAHQERPRRRVALKLIRPGIYSHRVLRRFEHEGDLLGRLQHPGIAQIFEAGRTDDPSPQPFLAMEFIEGTALTTYVTEHDLGTRERLELMAKICDATHHAHQKGIIHRDLKPANILVDAEGNPKILDFGIARLTNSDIDTVTSRTDVGELIGTVPYMSPEQVTGDPDVLDTRSDVYSLGVLLHEVLVGKLPYDVRRKSVLEAVRIIREEDPTPLSEFGAVFRGDLETIVAKALEKEKARRYGSASDLASDMRRYLLDEPIVARPASASYQLRKFARRHRGVVIGSAIALTVLVGGILVTSVAWWEAEKARAIAAEERADAIVARNREADARHLAERERTEADAARDAAIEAREEQRRLREAADAARDAAKREADVSAAIHGFMTLVLAGADPWIDLPYSEPSHSVTMMEVLDRAVAIATEELVEQPAVEAGVRTTIGAIYRNAGRADDAADQLRRALELHTEVVGATHPDTIRTRHMLGTVVHDLADYEDAERILREAASASEARHGPSAKPTLEIRIALASTLVDLARYEDAESILEDILRRNAEASDDFKIRYTTTYVLAGVHLHLGRLELAIERTEAALADAEAELGVGHARTLVPRFQLGQILKQDPARADESERHIRAAVDGARVQLGDDHPQTLFFLRSLASQLHSKGGHTRDVVRMLRLVAEGYRRRYGDDHIETIESIVTLGRILASSGNLDEARTFLEQGATSSRATLGASHRTTANAVLQLGVLEARARNLETATELLEEAVELNRTTRGDDSMFTAFALRNLALAWLDRGDLEAAERHIREALAINERVRGPDHPQTTENRSNLGEILLATGRGDEAGPIFRSVLEARERVLGPTHPGTLVALSTLSRFLVSEGRDDDAEPLLLRAWTGLREKRGPLHPDTLAVGTWLDELYRRRERYEDLAALYRQVVDAANALEARGEGVPDAPRIASYRGGLGACLIRLERPREAIPVLERSLADFLGDAIDTPSPIGPGDPRDVARSLVRAYEAIGETAAAQALRERLPSDAPRDDG